ncbi:MAG: hypothetical protein BWX58_00843 [Deltaproteobacteria bacterium ADurb.Bin026]|nr:MAG: hypothetical protein BWX58_00843 [Deltaproteobacteria bacterium ADurb.Bin026]
MKTATSIPDSAAFFAIKLTILEGPWYSIGKIPNLLISFSIPCPIAYPLTSIGFVCGTASCMLPRRIYFLILNVLRNFTTEST